jgi:hypothetical protein
LIKKDNSALTLVQGIRLDETRLQKHQYTFSLLNEAFRLKLIDPETVYNFQFQVMNLLKELISRYTGGESTSVTSDTAESLLCSILYAIDACTSSCSSPEEALRLLREGNITDLYNSGLEQTVKWFNETKELYIEIKKKRLDIKLEAYNLTISEAIPIFLEKYNMVFYAHHAAGSIDYPLVFDDMSLQGVLYIKNYLRHFKLETVFCRYFNEEEISRVLDNYAGLIRMDYKIELINVFELVFNNAAFSVLAGKTSISLLISQEDYKAITRRLTSSSSSSVCHEIDASIRELINRAGISSPDIIDYMNRYKAIFIKRVLHAVDNNTLGSMIITEQQHTPVKSKFSFELGERMSDAGFNLLIKKLKQLSKARDKIGLVLSSANSLYDFIDILISDCFFGEEYCLLFNSLGNLELAVLSKIVFYRELRDEFISFDNMIESYGTDSENEEDEWQKYFVKFLRNLPHNRASSIESCMSEVEYEEISFD